MKSDFRKPVVLNWVSQTCTAAVLVGTVGAAPQALADQLDRGSLEALFNEPVTLSATGAPQRVTEAPVNMVIISQAEIRRSGAVDLPGVLERLANVDVMRSLAGQADVSVRGYNTAFATRLLVLLNGRQVYLDHFGMTNWDLIPVAMAEIRQIEVVSGPNTALFGFNAAAGVINIITYDALQDDVDEVSATVGSHRYAAGAATWTGRANDRLGLRLSLGGFDTEASASDDVSVRAGAGTDAIDPSARRAALNLALDVSEDVRADFEAAWATDDRTARAVRNIFPTLQEILSLKAGVSADTPFGMLAAQIYSNGFDEAATFENRISVASLALVAKPRPRHTVRVSSEVRRNELRTDQSAALNGTLGYDVESLSGMWNWQARDALSVTTAVRYDALQLEREGPLPAIFPFTNADYDRDLHEWSYNLGAVVHVTPSDALRFSLARGVSLPSLADLGAILTPTVGPPIYVAGDPGTAPSIVENVELDWDHDIEAIGGRLRAALFWQRNEDLRSFASHFELVSPFPPVAALVTEPAGASEIRGVELTLNGAHHAWRWDAQYAWRDIQDALTVAPISALMDFDHTTPEHVATASLARVGDRFDLGADARYVSHTVQFGRGADLASVYPVDAHVQLNAYAGWRASPTATFELSGRNLLEERTQSTGLSPVERSFYLTLRSTF